MTKNLSFIYAEPLDGELRRSFAERGQAYPLRDEIREVMTRWRTLWKETDDTYRLIQTLCTITGRVPERNLECFVFGRGLIPMSTPFLLPIWNREGKQWSDEKFIDLVVHELLHIFLITNNDPYWKFVLEKYSTEEPATQNHLLLYAMMYQIYQETWQTEPLDFSRDNLPTGYARAITMVREIGYKELIAEYKQYAV